MYYYYLFICALYLGFFNLPDSLPGILRDMIFIPLLIYSILTWKKSPKGDLLEKILIFSFGVFVFYNIILLVTAEKYLSEITSLLNTRDIYPFILFFITISLVNNKEKFVKTLRYGLIMSFVAALFSIAQSIYGPTPMFDTELFYNIGHWEGQGGMMIGPIARVTLPTMYLIYIVFISLIIYYLAAGRIRYLWIIILLVIAILISYTRSAWLATMVALIVSTYFLSRNLLIKKNTYSVSFILLIILSVLIVVFMMLDNPISASLNDRLLSTFSDLQNASGTFGYRLVNFQRFIETWKSFGFYFGVDPFFIGRFREPTLSDVGYVYVLVTIGLVGLMMLVTIWILGIIYAIKTIKKGAASKTLELSLPGAVLLASVFYFIICQAYTQFSFVSSLFAIVYGLTIASRRIYNA